MSNAKKPNTEWRLNQALEMNERLNQQISNQIASINRLLDNSSATAEIVALQERLALLECKTSD